MSQINSEYCMHAECALAYDTNPTTGSSKRYAENDLRSQNILIVCVYLLRSKVINGLDFTIMKLYLHKRIEWDPK